MSLDLATYSRQAKYEHIGFASDIQTDLAELADRAQVAHARNRQYKRTTIFTWVILFISFMMGLLIPPIFLIVPIAIGELLVLWFLKSKEKRWSIPKERYVLASGLIQKVTRDMEIEPSLHLFLDGYPTKSKHKKIDTLSDPKRAKWKIDRYADPWLLLEGQFLDQTEFTLTLNEFYIEKYGWTRNPRGKHKHKRKEKPKGLSLTLTLRFQRKKYGAVTVLGDSLQAAIKLPNNMVKVKRLKMNDRTLTLTLKVPHHGLMDNAPNPPYGLIKQSSVEWLEQLITQMFLSLYHVLNLAQKLSKVTSS